MWGPPFEKSGRVSHVKRKKLGGKHMAKEKVREWIHFPF